MMIQLQLVDMMFSLTGQLCNVYRACVFVDDVCLYTFNSDAVACNWSDYFYNSRSMGIGKSSQPYMHVQFLHSSTEHACVHHGLDIFCMYIWLAVAQPIGMGQNGCSNQCIIIYMTIISLCSNKCLVFTSIQNSQAALQSAMAVIMVAACSKMF